MRLNGFVAFEPKIIIALSSFSSTSLHTNILPPLKLKGSFPNDMGNCTRMQQYHAFLLCVRRQRSDHDVSRRATLVS